VSNLDEVVAMIRTAANPAEARGRLLAKEWPIGDIAQYIRLVEAIDPSDDESGGTYRLSERQVKAILELRLHRLTALGRDEIGDELKGRGIFNKVDVETLRKAAPADWWGRKVGTNKVDVSLANTEWIILDRIENATSPETQAKLFPAGKDKKGRVIQRIYWPADMPVPPKFAGYTNRGKFEIREATPSTVTLWRDYTAQERAAMGEILDARYVAMRTVMLMADDIATAKLFGDMAQNPDWTRKDPPTDDEGKPLWVDGGNRKRWGTYSEAEWVRVPDTKIAGTGVAKYGAIAGMYVRAPIWRDMVQLENQQIPHFWRSLLTMWKKNKTVYSLKTHVFNVLSNVGLADLADIRAREVFSAIRHIIDQDGTFNDAVRHGAFGTGEVERKINREMLQPLLKALMDEKIDETDPGWLFKMQVVIARFAEKVDDMASGAYQMEDSIFRMAMYVKMVRQPTGTLATACRRRSRAKPGESSTSASARITRAGARRSRRSSASPSVRPRWSAVASFSTARWSWASRASTGSPARTSGRSSLSWASWCNRSWLTCGHSNFPPLIAARPTKGSSR
jgi:hypothetical protein